MLVFKIGLVVIPSTFVLSICFQIAKESNSLDIGLAFLYVASGAIAGKIIYDRYQQVHILGSLTANPNVTSFSNRIASCVASFLFLGFLVCFCLFLFKVDDRFLTALSIFLCGLSTLYIWIQCIITTYLSTLYFDQHVAGLRQGLANTSFLLLIVMAVLGTVTAFLPRSTSGVYICIVVTSICSHLIAAIFCIYILTFEKEYRFFAGGLRPDRLLDDDCSLGASDTEGLLGSREVLSNAMLIRTSIACAKTS